MESKPTISTQPLEQAMPSTTPYLASSSTPKARSENTLALVKRKLTTREGWFGSYDYAALCMPRFLPWSRPYRRSASLEESNTKPDPPFYGLNDELPISLAAICGLQHCLCMLAGLITPPIVLAANFNLDSATQAYMISASLITGGILSLLQISAIRIPFLPGNYQWGSGLLSVVGTSFATLGVASAIATNLYADGTCPMVSGPSGTMVKGACPAGIGYILGTSAVCALFEIFLSFIPPRALKRMFPQYITGPVVMLVGLSLLAKSGFLNLAGGTSCHAAGKLCPSANAPRPLPWGSPELIGMGFYSFAVLVLIEIFGSPAMRNASIVIALVFCTLTAGVAGGYTSRATIDSAPAVTFLWVKTFPLKVLGSAVLPMLIVYLVLAIEAIGDTSAAAEFSRVSTSGPEFDRRLQGAVLADGLAGVLSALFTVTPMSLFAQNTAAIQITSVANRSAGRFCCAWLILFGVLGKIAGAILAIPNSILGGVTSFLFASVIVAGLSLISKVKLTRRVRFILASSIMFGGGALLVPDWATSALLPTSKNSGVQGLIQSVQILLSTPYLISAIVGMILDSILPYDSEDILVLAAERAAFLAASSLERDAEMVTSPRGVSSSSGDAESFKEGDSAQPRGKGAGSLP